MAKSSAVSINENYDSSFHKYNTIGGLWQVHCMLVSKVICEKHE